MNERGIDRWVWTVLALLQTTLAIAGVIEGAHPAPLAFFVLVAIALSVQAVRSWRA